MGMKSLASTLVFAGCCWTNAASAVNLNPNGIGQVLIYPYYTVNKSQDTLISVTNASDIGTAVQVNILEGHNGRDVLNFILFLSPHDVWTASISQIADDGGAVLRTSDTSCTYPPIPAAGQPFQTFAFDGRGVPPFNIPDSGPQGATRTREGWIELIVGGDIAPGSPTDIATRHVQTGNPGEGVPPACANLAQGSPQADLRPPTGGILGSGTIVNVGEGTFFGYNPDALQGFTDSPLSYNAGGIFVTLQLAYTEESARTATAYLSTASGRPLAVDYDLGIDAVSAVFMADSLYNDYLVAPSLGANTDWIVTFPTKRFYTDDLAYAGAPRAPFAEAFDNGESNVYVSGVIYDREEGSSLLPQPGCGEQCPPPAPSLLPYAVNVISFQSNFPPSETAVASGVFGSLLTKLFVPPFGDDGSLVLDLASGDAGHTLPGGTDAQGNEVILRGLPVTGFMSYNIINTQAQPGMLANYGGAFHHRATMSCFGPADECDATNTGTPGSSGP